VAPHCSEALYPCTDPCLVAVACACSELWLDAGLQAGPNPFTMGVDHPNKRAAEQAGKKGKPARRAGANIKSTAGASKPAHAAATSSEACVHGSTGMQGPPPSQPPQQVTSQGQHHAALSQPAHAPDSAVVAHTAHESASPVATESAALVAADSASPVAAESAAPVAADSASPAAAEATSSVVAGPPSSRAADLAAVTTAVSASGVAGVSAEEEAREGTGLTPIVDSLSDSTVAEGRSLLSATDLIHVENEVCSQCIVDRCRQLPLLHSPAPARLHKADRAS